MKIFVALIDGLKTVNEELNFQNEIKGNDDFIDIDPCFVTGTLEMINQQLHANLNIKVKLTLASSRSLKPIELKQDFDLDLIFGSGLDADYLLDNEIDFKDLIFAHILLEKPYSIYLEDEIPHEQKVVTNPAFKELKDWVL